MYASQGKENEEKTIVILLCETPLDLESKLNQAYKDWRLLSM